MPKKSVIKLHRDNHKILWLWDSGKWERGIDCIMKKLTRFYLLVYEKKNSLLTYLIQFKIIQIISTSKENI